jgi:Spy/CpxP family protein refolding chaperone
MKSRWSVASLAMIGLLAAAIAFAADQAKTPAPKAPQPAANVAPGDAGPGPAWTWDEGGDDPGLLAFGDDDGGGGWQPGAGPGMGPGRGQGMGPGMGMRWMQRMHRGGRGMGQGMGRGARMGRGMAGAFARLDLTDAQREKIRAIHERQARKDIQARADMQVARMDLRDLMRADSPNATAINSQIDRLARMRADMQKARVAVMLEARSVLTPEQRKQLQDMRRAGPAGPGRGMGMRRGQPQDDGTKSD